MSDPNAIRISEDKTSSAQDKELCSICHRQFYRYTCPGCNVSYCSLMCFRSEAHSQCSEAFYRKEIQTSANQMSKTSEQRGKMLEVLKRLENQIQEEDSDLLQDEANSDTDDLVDRFAGVDISSATSDELIRLLTREEREKFFNAVRNPTSQLAQQLLASEELRSVREEPWWEASFDGSPNERVRYGTIPALMEVPLNLAKHPSSSPYLIYNICAVLIAYVFATRRLSVSPLSSAGNDASDEMEARKIISQAVPFLVTRNSKVLHPTLSDAITSVWSRFDPDSVGTESFSMLLHDLSIIVRPRKVVAIQAPPDNSSLNGHPSVMLLAALSDLSDLFSPRPIGVSGHIQMKLRYYAAQVLSMPQHVLSALAEELQVQAQVLRAEGDAVMSP